MKKYLVFGEEYETISEAVEAFMDAVDEDTFDDYLHDEYGCSVDICGEDFDPVELLRDYDSSLYEDKFEDWKREVEEEVEDTIGYMEADDIETLYGIDIECIDDEDEDEEEENASQSLLSTVYSAEDRAKMAVSDALEAAGKLEEFLKGIPSLYLNKTEADKYILELRSALSCLYDYLNKNGDSES